MSNADQIDQVHERLMKNDTEYRDGYEFVKHNRRYYENHSKDDIEKLAQTVAKYWDPNDSKPHTFALGAAAALLELAKAKKERIA